MAKATVRAMRKDLVQVVSAAQRIANVGFLHFICHKGSDFVVLFFGYHLCLVALVEGVRRVALHSVRSCWPILPSNMKAARTESPSLIERADDYKCG